MNKYLFFLFGNLLLLPDGFAASLLKATKFPETFDDISFIERVEVLKQGYEPYETVFDENGVCITNCAYKGLTIKEEQEKNEINTEKSWLESLKWDDYKLNDIKEMANNKELSTEHRETVKKYVKYVSDNKKQNVQINHNIFNPGRGDNAMICRYGTHRSDIPYDARSPKYKPVLGVGISSQFGVRQDPINPNRTVSHYGIDYLAPLGTPVYATAWGRVNYTGWVSGYGNTIQLQHPDGTYSFYAHLDRIVVDVGEIVSGGCVIALSGNTGKSTGPHLHYSIISSDRKTWVDPNKYIGR